MSFAELSSYIRQGFAALTDADMPVDALTARLIANNAQHSFDQRAQTLVNMAESSLGTLTLSVGTSWTRMLTLGPFPARLRPSQGTYRYRVRAQISRTGAGPVLFRFAIGRMQSVDSALINGNPAASLFATSVNTSAVTTVTPTNSIIAPLNEMVPGMYESISTRDAGGNVVAALAPLVWVGIAVKSSTGTQTARLAGLSVTEYVGTP